MHLLKIARLTSGWPLSDLHSGSPWNIISSSKMSLPSFRARKNLQFKKKEHLDISNIKRDINFLVFPKSAWFWLVGSDGREKWEGMCRFWLF